MLAGTTEAQVRFRFKEYVFLLLQLGGTGCNLSELDWFHAPRIGLEGIHQVINKPSTCLPTELQIVLNCRHCLIDEYLTRCTGHPVGIDLDAGGAPRF